MDWGQHISDISSKASVQFYLCEVVVLAYAEY